MAFNPQIIEEFEIDLINRTCARPWPYSKAMLMLVSRTFALNIQVLPLNLNRSILLAYLFCRMADTVEDDAELSASAKEVLLNQFRAIFDESKDWKVSQKEFVNNLPELWKDSDHNDICLTQYPEWPLGVYFDQSDFSIATTAKWVDEMCKGMIEYSLKREERNGRLQLESLAELDEYCYYVAGTVGYMLTDLFRGYSSLIGSAKYEKLKSLSNSFGLALQITNIIKDIHEDYYRDTCFVPAELMRKHGVEPQNFLEAKNKEASMAVVRELVKKALGHLDDALEYSLTLPRLEPRLRLFCLWPLLMASRTLAIVLTTGDVLGEKKVKITRPEVKSIIRGSTLRVLSNKQLRSYFAKDRELILKYAENKI